MDRRLPIILGLFLVVTISGAFIGAMEWDEGSFLMNAERFHGTGTNFEESRPAALSYAIATLWHVTGENIVVSRLLIVLTGVAAILIFHRLASQDFADPLPVTAVFALSPLLLYWSFHAYTDVPALLFVLASLYSYRQHRPIAAGALLAVAATIRYVFAVFAVGMAAAYLFQHRDRFGRYAAGGVLGALPFFTYSTVAYGSPFAKIVMYVTRVAEWSGSGPFTATLSSLGSAAVMLSALVPAAYIGWDETPAVEKWLVAVYAAFFLFVSGNAFTRYWLPVTPLLLLMAYRGLDRTWFLTAAGVTLVVSGAVVGGNMQTTMTCQEPLQDALDYITTETDGPVVSDNWAITGYVLDRPVYSPWTDYTQLQRRYNVTHAVTSEQLPYRTAAQFSNSCRTYHIYDITQSV